METVLSFYRADTLRAASWNRFVMRNHVITRIKRSTVVGTNLISEFPAANYFTAVSPVGGRGGRRRNSGPLAKLLEAWAAFPFVSSRAIFFFLDRPRIILWSGTSLDRGKIWVCRNEIKNQKSKSVVDSKAKRIEILTKWRPFQILHLSVSSGTPCTLSYVCIPRFVGICTA